MAIEEGTVTYLGRLCARGHDYEESGKSLRYCSSHGCIACGALRMGRVGDRGDTTYLGALCKRGHDHDGSGGSLRYSGGHTCVVCARAATLRERAEHPERAKARTRGYQRAWKQRHPERAALIVQRYRQSSRFRATRAAWMAATREARLAYARLTNRRRYARRHGGVCVRYSLEDIAVLFGLYGGRCAYCGARASEVDHVIPLSRRGHDALYNFAPACRSCNARKYNYLLEEWYPRQPFFRLERLEFMAAQHVAAGLSRLGEMI